MENAYVTLTQKDADAAKRLAHEFPLGEDLTQKIRPDLMKYKIRVSWDGERRDGERRPITVCLKAIRLTECPRESV